jgi:hypothetical protein
MMKSCLIVCLLAGSVPVCIGQVAAAEKPSAEAVLMDGTPIKLKAPPTFNAAAVRVGDPVELSVAEPVLVNGVIVISTNNVANAVVSSQGNRVVKSDVTNVRINLRSVTLADGEHIPLRIQRQVPPGLPAETVTSSGAQDLSIGSGSELTAYVVGNLTLDLSRLRLADQPAGELRITSTPSSAELSIDGRTVGVAPYTAHLTRGEHAIVVRAAGYAAWHRTLPVGDQASDLQVQLQRQDSTEPIPQTKSAATPSLGELARQARAKKAAQEQQKSSDPVAPNAASPNTAPAQN